MYFLIYPHVPNSLGIHVSRGTRLFVLSVTESGHGVGDAVGPGLSFSRVGLEDDPEGVDDAREEAEEGEQDVDEQLQGEAVHHEHGNWWEKEAEEKSHDSVGVAITHQCLVSCHSGFLYLSLFFPLTLLC